MVPGRDTIIEAAVAVVIIGDLPTRKPRRSRANLKVTHAIMRAGEQFRIERFGPLILAQADGCRVRELRSFCTCRVAPVNLGLSVYRLNWIPSKGLFLDFR
jgi:hypothetical protein